MKAADDRIGVLYLAPWVDIGGSDTATIDWFARLDGTSFRASLITTQPAPNRRLAEVEPYAEELWELPELMRGVEMPRFILGFIHSRGIDVVHIMNSRLGFELLPDIAGLPNPPKVVVQSHGEQPGRTGYVRYVTMRYGNLVDAYSITTDAYAGHLAEYGVPRAKQHVIPIGVDADWFSPKRFAPVPELDPSRFHILFPARLTAQKDPLLMVEVAAQLRARELLFQLHVLGDGELLGGVRARLRELGLEREVILHGAQPHLGPWYAACAATLLTSVYETSIPRAAYEAMAMAKPIVAPALDSIGELVGRDTGMLVSPRDDPDAYAEALLALATDEPRRTGLGRSARAHVQSAYGLERMATAHEDLYRRLLAARPRAVRGGAPGSPTARPGGGRAPGAATSAAKPFTRPPAPAQPLISVIMTCFDQALTIPAGLESLQRQTETRLEILIVDDGSSDADTLALLDSLEREGMPVIRLPVNRGPAAARNAGIECARGDFVLFLDGDDVLPAGTLAALATQLQAAAPEVGFVYPHLRFFGNRQDHVAMPDYDVHALLERNFCPVSSLFAREVFARGHRFAGEITLGHEDWDLVLTLAEDGIHGQAASDEVHVRCRCLGFTRSELVNANGGFADVIAGRHPELFARRALLKGQWNPSLTVLALGGPDGAGALAELARRQTCPDFELLLPGRAPAGDAGLDRRLTGLGLPADASAADALAAAVMRARGRFMLALAAGHESVLADPSTIERLLRLLESDAAAAVALSDAGDGPAWRRVDPGPAAAPEALAWRLRGAGAPPATLCPAAHEPLDTLARWLSAQARLQWRQAPRRGADAPWPALPHPGPLPRRAPGPALGSSLPIRAASRPLRDRGAELPVCPPGLPRRLERDEPWRPIYTRLLCRHRSVTETRFTYSDRRSPPAGHELDAVLGWVRTEPIAGTMPLVTHHGDWAVSTGAAPGESGRCLGHVETEYLSLLEPLLAGRLAATGQVVLMRGEHDPLAGRLEDVARIGYIEPCPPAPDGELYRPSGWGLTGLLRTVDPAARRHRYGTGRSPAGVPAGELGALLTEPAGDCRPVYISPDGRLSCEGTLAPPQRPSWGDAARWAADPLTWRAFAPLTPRLRACARRLGDAGGAMLRAPTPARVESPPAGYLFRVPGPGTVTLYAAAHPVTGDQLLSTAADEAARLGYGPAIQLGYLVAQAPVTGRLGPVSVTLPWARRFGLSTAQA